MRDELSGGRRVSGLELLRIISMLMIVDGHFVEFGGYEPFTVQNLGGGGNIPSGYQHVCPDGLFSLRDD